jgi:Flp pilus assembly protein TadG
MFRLAPSKAGRPARGKGQAGRFTRSPQKGAVMVEFAFGLMFIMCLFVVFTQIEALLLTHQRLRYAAASAARAYAVGGSPEQAASKLDSDYTLKKQKSGTAGAVTLTKRIELPGTVGDILGTGPNFTIAQSVKAYVESTSYTGDNKPK